MKSAHFTSRIIQNGGISNQKMSALEGSQVLKHQGAQQVRGTFTLFTALRRRLPENHGHSDSAARIVQFSSGWHEYRGGALVAGMTTIRGKRETRNHVEHHHYEGNAVRFWNN